MAAMKTRWNNRLRLLPLALAVSGCAWLRPDLAARVATGTTAHDVCSETFVSHQDSERTFAESIAPRPGISVIAPLLRYEVDRDAGTVRASLAGGFASLAVYRGRDGCLLAASKAVARMPAPLADARPAVPLALAPGPSGLGRVLDEAFAENAGGPRRNTKAVVILHRGRVVAQRFADGYGPDTPILGFSLSKSVVHALTGILVADGRLRLDTPLFADERPGPVPTVENALRMTTGLDLDETGSGFDPSNHLLYVHTDDMAAFARQARTLASPGQRWAYSSASTHLLARLLRDTAGGPEALQRFARARLFVPLGMGHVTVETDATGTPIGAHYILASPHDWARFGMLYLDDGVAPDGRRLLPAGWIRWSTEPTLDTDYGAGWWLNRRAAAARGTDHDMPLMRGVPPDAFYALGNLGQYIVVVPSRQLVVVRLGRAHTPAYDSAGMERLVAGAIAVLGDAVNTSDN
jgi:CubicO group peptidase (beta-lactamase class C family)